MNKLLQCNLKLFLNSLKVNHGFCLKMMSNSKRTWNTVETDCDRKKLKHTESTQVQNSPINQQFGEKAPAMYGIGVMDTPDKPETDKKSYRAIKLQNQLNVLLVSDLSSIQKEVQLSKHKPALSNRNRENVAVNNEASSSEDEYDSESSDESSIACDDKYEEDQQKKKKMAACSLSVDVGSFSDPRNIQGLAHFLGKFKYYSVSLF